MGTSDEPGSNPTTALAPAVTAVTAGTDAGGFCEAASASS